MSLRMTVSVEELRKNLASVRIDKSYGQTYTYDFTDYLATHLLGENTIGAEDFLLQIELAFMDLKKGTVAGTGELIRHHAADRVPAAEMFIRMDLPAVFKAVFTPEFAAEVIRVRDEVNAEIAEAKANKPVFV